MSIKKYIQALSPYTLFVFASTKLFIWSLGMIIFHSRFEMDVFSLNKFAATKYVMFLISVLGFVAIKLRKYLLSLLISTLFVFIWIYVTIGFGIGHGWVHSANFLRNVAETAFIIYLYLRVNTDRNIVNGA